MILDFPIFFSLYCKEDNSPNFQHQITAITIIVTDRLFFTSTNQWGVFETICHTAKRKRNFYNNLECFTVHRASSLMQEFNFILLADVSSIFYYMQLKTVNRLIEKNRN